MKKTIAIVILIIGCIIALRATKPYQAQTQKVQQNAPCSTNANPCITLTQSDGTKYQLNDFRFLGKDCIAFISLPDKQERQTCNYRLEWIGPGESKII